MPDPGLAVWEIGRSGDLPHHGLRPISTARCANGTARFPDVYSSEAMTPLDGVMVGSYDRLMVVVSVVIALLASYTALDLAERITAARGTVRRRAWLISGAMAMGIGIWSMHYTGMLAFRLPVPVLYHWPTVLLSLLAGIVASAIALFVVSRKRVGWLGVLAGGVSQGAAITGLHYTAMAAMRMSAMCHYSPAIVGLSVLFAIAGSLLSLWLTFIFRVQAAGRRRRKATTALLMGAAICIMHYTAMAAASFTSSGDVPNLSQAVRVTPLGIAGIVTVTVMVLVGTLTTSLLDRLQERSVLLDELFEQAPQAIALMSADHRVIRVNREFTRLFGYTRQETVGRRLTELIVPGKSGEEVQTYPESVSHGQRVEAEAVRQRKDGRRVHVLAVSVPVSMPSGQIAVYVMYGDITERKEAEAALRLLSGRLLRLEDEERRRLARELHDSTAQLLAALSINLFVVNESASVLNPRAQDAIAESVNLADQCLREIRTVSYLLHPPDLDELGLQSALARYIDGFGQRSGINVQLEVSPNLGRLPQEIETTIFRVVQESLTNIHRHSGSSTASIRLIRGPTEIILEVKDAGRGIPAGATPGVGIASMRERVQQLDGRLEVGSNHAGTIVKAFIPLSKAAP
jgi:two-component system NarL family sensor kinase